jgi:hypothetical protein
MAISITSITPNSSYAPADESLLNSSTTSAFFSPDTDYIEYTISTPDLSFINTNPYYNRYSFPTSGVTSGSISDIIINPPTDLTSTGITSGEYNVYYNFLKNELSSSIENPRFFIKEISADRTEVVLSVNNPNVTLIDEVNNFKSSLNSSEYFQDFYLNFGNNVLSIANNIDIDNDTLDVFINLYAPLSDSIQLKTQLWVVTQVADTLAFNIVITEEPIIPSITSFPIKGPNVNLPIKDQINNSTGQLDYGTLVTSSLLSTSYSQLNGLLSSSGANINVDYTDFSNFIHFSSATQRIKNFAEKVYLIQEYSASIAYTGSLSGYTTQNTSILTSQMNNIIENFDGYERFLYYSTGSYSWPKSTTTVPYTLYPSGSSQVINWLGTEGLDNPTGILGSASIYDGNNLDYIYNVVPLYIQDDTQNDPYKLFVEMVAQHYDNIWIYYKDINNRYNADNRLDFGISKDLVADALKSFGIKLYQNNFSTNDLYAAFLGYGSNDVTIDTTLPVAAGSGLEYISRTISASYDARVTPLDDVNKETYKRLYHNLPYLAKTKGTIPGLRALINCFGIPDTILRISEFGGRDKDTSTYDYFDQKYNYKVFINDANFGQTPWTLNSNWNSTDNRPESIQFRFQTAGISGSVEGGFVYPWQSQSLFLINGGTYISALVLQYTGSGYASASYSGSTYSASYQYANLTYYPNTASLTSTASIYLPFYDGGWWSVMLNKSGDTFTLYAGNKLYYDGYDGNQIGFLASSSITQANNGWEDGNNAYLSYPGVVINSKTYLSLNGYFQELRYWSKTGSVEVFKDFIMNPSSIDYDGDENNYANYLAFRYPLGNELYSYDSLYILNNLKSIHPKITGSWAITQSFTSNSDFYTEDNTSVYPNIESFFYDQPIAGIKNRVTDKIQIVSSSYATGSVLSQYISIEQNYPTSGSETPDINLLEVAFSPQNEINNDIISSLGYFNIGEYIGDPRQVSSSATTYPDLNRLSNDFFQKYFASYNLFDYIRLIKYFDNSLFKMIQDFVPARTSLVSGVVIKQHLLERNKYPQPQVEWEELDYSGSITTAFIDGGTGGTFDSYNFTGSVIPPTFINNTQSWGEEVKTPIGLLTISHSTQDEFYNGELPYSDILVSDGELNPDNTFKDSSVQLIYYSSSLYVSNITNESTFTNPLTSPNPGEVYLWWDSGSLTNPGNTIYVKPTFIQVTSLGRTAANFLVNKTNGVKYIKLNNIDARGNDQSDYLTQLQTITLTYPDRSDITYNIAGVQNLGNYHLYSIGPYVPGSMTNFNTSSAGDINNYTLQTSQSSFSGTPGTNILTASLISTTDPLNYFNNTTHIYTLGNTPNIALRFELTASLVTTANPGDAIIYLLSNTNFPGSAVLPENTTQGAPDYRYAVNSLQVNGGASGQNSIILSGSLSLLDSTNFIIGVAGTFNAGNITINTINFNITPVTPEFNGSASLTIFDPYVPNFDYNEYNVLLNNADIPRKSIYFMDVDYSQNPVTPVNQSLILSESADRAYVQDSNYTSQAWSTIRYRGSKYTSIKPSI